MLEGFLHLFARRSLMSVLTDLADILVVTYVVYRALLVLRGTRAMQMGMGLGVIFLVYVVSKWAGFVTLFNLLNALLSSIILIVVVVFQNDIRRGLMRVGVAGVLRRARAPAGVEGHRRGRGGGDRAGAAPHRARSSPSSRTRTSTSSSSGRARRSTRPCSASSLVALFLPESLNKLHDGAVIIRNLRIAKAGVFFPMPDTKVLDKSLGSRHRAALGITEETDAVVVVVSEERGSISFCFNGNIVTNLDGASLRQALLGLFGQRARKRAGKPSGKRGTGSVTQTGTGSFRVTLRRLHRAGSGVESARGERHRLARDAAAAGRAPRPRQPCRRAPAAQEREGAAAAGRAADGAGEAHRDAEPAAPTPDAPTRPREELSHGPRLSLALSS